MSSKGLKPPQPLPGSIPVEPKQSVMAPAFASGLGERGDKARAPPEVPTDDEAKSDLVVMAKLGIARLAALARDGVTMYKDDVATIDRLGKILTDHAEKRQRGADVPNYDAMSDAEFAEYDRLAGKIKWRRA